MKIIPKGQWGLVTQSDNTRVAKPIIQEKVPYKLKPNEFYFVDPYLTEIQFYGTVFFSEAPEDQYA